MRQPPVEEKSLLEEVEKDILSKLTVLAVSVGAIFLINYRRKSNSPPTQQVQPVQQKEQVQQPSVNYEEVQEKQAFPSWEQ